MKPIERFSLRPATSGPDDIQSGQLVFDGKPVALQLRGVVLEAQFDCDPGYLLFTTNNSPYEEVVHVYLLDRSLSVLDALEIGAPYTGGTLRDVRPEARDRLSFLFAGDERWLVRVASSPRRTLLGDAPGVRRLQSRLWAKRYVTVERVRTS